MRMCAHACARKWPHSLKVTTGFRGSLHLNLMHEYTNPNLNPHRDGCRGVCVCVYVLGVFLESHSYCSVVYQRFGRSDDKS